VQGVSRRRFEATANTKGSGTGSGKAPVPGGWLADWRIRQRSSRMQIGAMRRARTSKRFGHDFVLDSRINSIDFLHVRDASALHIKSQSSSVEVPVTCADGTSADPARRAASVRAALASSRRKTASSSSMSNHPRYRGAEQKTDLDLLDGAGTAPVLRINGRSHALQNRQRGAPVAQQGSANDRLRRCATVPLSSTDARVSRTAYKPLAQIRGIETTHGSRRSSVPGHTQEYASAYRASPTVRQHP